MLSKKFIITLILFSITVQAAATKWKKPYLDITRLGSGPLNKKSPVNQGDRFNGRTVMINIGGEFVGKDQMASKSKREPKNKTKRKNNK